MKKRIESLVLAVMMVFSFAFGVINPSITARAEGGVTIKLHYNRPDGDYEPWRVWFWEEGSEGADYFFEEENG